MAYNNICKELNWDSKYCNGGVLEKGLETSSVFLVENSRKILNTFDQNSEEGAKNILNGDEIENLGKIKNN